MNIYIMYMFIEDLGHSLQTQSFDNPIGNHKKAWQTQELWHLIKRVIEGGLTARPMASCSAELVHSHTVNSPVYQALTSIEV